MSTRLPDDRARCHDDQCPSREMCQRWIQRDRGGPRTPHVTSMRYMTGCEYYDYDGLF